MSSADTTPEQHDSPTNATIDPPVSVPLASPKSAMANAQANGTDNVERALAAALTEATKAAQWSVVAQLAGELEARRKSR